MLIIKCPWSVYQSKHFHLYGLDGEKGTGKSYW